MWETAAIKRQTQGTGAGSPTLINKQATTLGSAGIKEETGLQPREAKKICHGFFFFFFSFFLSSLIASPVLMQSDERPLLDSRHH